MTLAREGHLGVGKRRLYAGINYSSIRIEQYDGAVREYPAVITSHARRLATDEDHHGEHGDGKKQQDEKGQPRIYEPGDIIQTSKDLSLLNYKGMPLRYQRVQPEEALRANPVETTEIQEPPSREDDLEDMTIASLRRLAEDEEIDLGDAVRKGHIIEAIRKGLG